MGGNLEEILFWMELTIEKLRCAAETLQPYFADQEPDLQVKFSKYHHYKMCAHLLIDQVYDLQEHLNQLYALAEDDGEQMETLRQIDMTLELVERAAQRIFDKFCQSSTQPLWVVCFAKEFLERLQWIFSGADKVYQLLETMRRNELSKRTATKD